jgi:hypothetical protein
MWFLPLNKYNKGPHRTTLLSWGVVSLVSFTGGSHDGHGDPFSFW